MDKPIWARILGRTPWLLRHTLVAPSRFCALVLVMQGGCTNEDSPPADAGEPPGFAVRTLNASWFPDAGEKLEYPEASEYLYPLTPIVVGCSGGSDSCPEPIDITLSRDGGTVAGSYSIYSIDPLNDLTTFTPLDPLTPGGAYTITTGVGLSSSPTEVVFGVDPAWVEVLEPATLGAGRTWSYEPWRAHQYLDASFSPQWDGLVSVFEDLFGSDQRLYLTLTNQAEQSLEFTFWSGRGGEQDFCYPTFTTTAPLVYDNTVQLSTPWFPAAGELDLSDDGGLWRLTFSAAGEIVWIDVRYMQDYRELLWDVYDFYNAHGTPCTSDGAPVCYEKWLVDVIRFTPRDWEEPIEAIAQANCHPRCAESANNPDCAS